MVRRPRHNRGAVIRRPRHNIGRPRHNSEVGRVGRWCGGYARGPPRLGPPYDVIHESKSNPSRKKRFWEMMAAARRRGALWKGGTSAPTAGEFIMTKHVYDGRRLLLQLLLGVNLVIWGACPARADEPE